MRFSAEERQQHGGHFPGVCNIVWFSVWASGWLGFAERNSVQGNFCMLGNNGKGPFGGGILNFYVSRQGETTTYILGI